ncbi:MAG TPA: hypothetical protein VEL76_40135 [Gemmataceae bacterium]|nr:hypothetical protein [Gemmataceae bacterium]
MKNVMVAANSADAAYIGEMVLAVAAGQRDVWQRRSETRVPQLVGMQPAETAT